MLRNKIIATLTGKPVNSSVVSPQQLSAHKRASRLRNLIRKEARVGSMVFGPTPAGHTRDFFCLDEATWIWSEQWYDASTKTSHHMLVRYEFQTRGVLKTVDGVAKGYVEGQELQNLVTAIESYADKVSAEVYGQQLLAA